MPRPKKTSAAERVVAYIHAYIKEKGLKPGDSLPTEGEIAKTTGLSRPTVREGMGRLRGLGFIKSKTRLGPRLANTNARDILTTIIPTLAQTKAQFHELAEFRAAVEVGAVWLAAARRTAGDIAALEEIVAREREAMNKGVAAYKVEDTAFHLKLLEISHNSLIMAMGDVIATYIDSLSVRDATRTQESVMRKRSHIEHVLILDAITKRDFSGAGAVMRMHIESSLEALRAIAQL